MRHDKFLSLARNQAAKSRYARWPMGAVLVKGGRVQGASPNIVRNPAGLPGLPWEDCSTHAEMAVLKKCSQKRGGTMYVARLLRTGFVGLARPCRRCERALIEFGVQRVVWTVDCHSYGVTNLREINSSELLDI